MDNQQKIQELLQKLELLLRKQDTFQVEVNQIKRDIYRLSNQYKVEEDLSNLPQDALEGEVEWSKEEPPAAPEPPPWEKPNPKPPTSARDLLPDKALLPKKETEKEAKGPPQAVKKDWLTTYLENLAFEQFIGENLINKIGILITVIGVGIGARYAIDNNMISPLTRIIFGYLIGFGLLGTAFRMKSQYENFSSVLLSGAMAILYFITFAAFSFYGLIPRVVAFLLMVIFTIFTVLAALHYNRQIIAVLGLVGAYAVPFLLSSGSGDVLTLYSYMTIINIGVLIVAVRKYWKPLYHLAFGITWLIFASWLFTRFNLEEHFAIGLIFSLIFFLIFYGSFLGYKIWRKEELVPQDLLLLMANSFIFFGFGYMILMDHETFGNFLGLFTVFNALIHFVVSVGVYYRRLANKLLFYSVAGLVLVFITMAIPIQLDGQWVTLIWSMEAVLLFWLGRRFQVGPYEQWSYVLLLLAFLSLFQDWANHYNQFVGQEEIAAYLPIFNIGFLGSFLFLAALGAFMGIQRKFPEIVPKDKLVEGYSLINSLLPAVFLFILYLTFFLEIQEYFNNRYFRTQYYADDGIAKLYDTDINSFMQVWLIHYSMAFFTILAFVYQKWFKERNWGIAIDALLMISLGAFLTIGLFELSELRDSYLLRDKDSRFEVSVFQIMLRYLSYLFCGALMGALYQRIRKTQAIAFELIVAVTVLWLLSAELINIRSFMSDYPDYKIGLSILWGVYSLVLVGLGIAQRKKHLRIAAMVLFGLTLGKLFLYDIIHLNTIAKTVVMVSLGILLLIFSFLYNKFQIDDEKKDDEQEST